MQTFLTDESPFLSVLLTVLGVGGAIFALAAGALILFWKSLQDDPGAAAEKGSEGARVNRTYFVRFAALLLILLLLSVAIFWMGAE